MGETDEHCCLGTGQMARVTGKKTDNREVSRERKSSGETSPEAAADGRGACLERGHLGRACWSGLEMTPLVYPQFQEQ